MSVCPFVKHFFYPSSEPFARVATVATRELMTECVTSVLTAARSGFRSLSFSVGTLLPVGFGTLVVVQCPMLIEICESPITVKH